MPIVAEVPISDVIRHLTYRRDGSACLRCGSREQLSIDHLRPRSLGGSDDPANLRTLCISCNSSRSNLGGDTIESICEAIRHHAEAARFHDQAAKAYYRELIRADSEWHGDYQKRLSEVVQALNNETISDRDVLFVVAILEALELINREQHQSNCKERIQFSPR